MKSLSLVLLIGTSALLLGGCTDADAAFGKGKGQGQNTPQEQIQVGTLTAIETSDLLFLREEEKLAYDVYKTLEEKWGAQTFTNISTSEQRHASQAAKVLAQYSIADPAQTTAIGVFANADLQKLYTELVAKGSVSLEEAMKVGAFIEEYDIKDLREKKMNTSNPSLLALYDKLEKGSHNHLRAFSKNISQYIPQILSEEEYSAILQGSNEMKGGNGNGKGKGNH